MKAAGSMSISGMLDRVLQRRRWAHIVETRRDGVFRAICGVALLAKGAGHSLRNASCSSSRKISVAAPRDLIRGSLDLPERAVSERGQAFADGLLVVGVHPCDY